MKIIIIGNGMVSHKFCEKLLSKKLPVDLQITIFGEELRPAYDRVHLSEYFSGKTDEDLQLASADWYSEKGIELHLGDPVQHIDRTEKTVRSFNGITRPYDYSGHGHRFSSHGSPHTWY